MRIYVAPTAKSLAGLQKYSKDAELNKKIIELVYLAQVLDSLDIECLTLPEYMASCEDEVALDRLHIPNDYVWSKANLEASWNRYNTMVAEQQLVHDQTKSILANCIARLPNLRAVQVQTKIDKPGLNADQFFFTDDYGKKHPVGEHQESLCTSLDGGEQLAFRFASDHNFLMDGVNYLFEALISRGPHTTLIIGNGLQDPAEYTISYNNTVPESLNLLAPRLTHLTLSIKDCATDGENEEEATLGWRGVFKAANNLRYLQIYPELNKDAMVWKCREDGTVLNDLLAHHKFPFLETFRVVGSPGKPTNVRAVCLNAFLRRHEKTIRHLELTGVLIVNWLRSTGTAAIMGTSIRKMKSELKLQTARMLLDRRDEHNGKTSPDTKSESEWDKTRHRGYPSTVQDEWISMEQLDTLAKDLRVSIEDGQWDFGDFIMRQAPASGNGLAGVNSSGDKAAVVLPQS